MPTPDSKQSAVAEQIDNLVRDFYLANGATPQVAEQVIAASSFNTKLNLLRNAYQAGHINSDTITAIGGGESFKLITGKDAMPTSLGAVGSQPNLPKFQGVMDIPLTPEQKSTQQSVLSGLRSSNPIEAAGAFGTGLAQIPQQFAANRAQDVAKVTGSNPLQQYVPPVEPGTMGPLAPSSAMASWDSQPLQFGTSGDAGQASTTPTYLDQLQQTSGIADPMQRYKALATLKSQVQSSLPYDASTGQPMVGDATTSKFLNLIDAQISNAAIDIQMEDRKSAGSGAAAAMAQVAESRRQFDISQAYKEQQDALNREFQQQQEKTRIQQALAEMNMTGASTMGSAYSQAQGQSLQAMRSAWPTGSPYTPGMEPGGAWAGINAKLGLPFNPTPVPQQTFNPNVAPGVTQDLVNKALQQAQQMLQK